MKSKWATVFTFLTFILTTTISLAQKQSNNWYFGNKAAISFTTGAPTTLTDGGTFAPEGVATISDKNGHLLFYTDGIKVWNKQHLYMLNGTQLLGHASSTQSGIIVPQPGNDSIFYIFTVDAFGGFNGLNYSKVNMNRDNGLGDVVQLPVQLLTSTCEKITALKHCNNKDIWVITRGFNDNRYYAWLVTSSGVASTPVVSTTNNTIDGVVQASIGYLKGSPDGKKVACVNSLHYTELSDFNTITGFISNTLKIANRSLLAGSDNLLSYGVEFSADNKYLYTSTLFNLGIAHVLSAINQYSITVHDSAAIAQSHYEVTSDNSKHAALQLGIDNKIYVADNGKNKLSRINSPNVQGNGCNFQVDAIDLGTGRSFSGLPTFIQSVFSPTYGGYNFSVIDDCNPLLKKFVLNDAMYVDSVKWNFDDIASGIKDSSTLLNPTHTFTTTRSYNVRLRVFKRTPCITGIDTIENPVPVTVFTFNLGTDKDVCENQKITLDATTNGANTYAWSTGVTTPLLDVTESGNYWCKVTINTCNYRDTVIITKKLLPSFSLTATNTTLCNNQPVFINANVDPLWQMLWQDGSTANIYKATSSGKYWLQASNDCGAIKKDIEIKKGICSVYIPNAFTPNNDNYNNTFIILGTELIIEFHLQIFNRYGQVLFETKDKNNGWDGKINGKLVDSGTYAYTLKYKSSQTKILEQINGTVILIR